MVRIGDDEDVLAKAVDDGEAVGRECANAARGLVPVLGDATLEALLAMRQGGAPHVGEIVADDEVGRFGAVGVDRDPLGRRLHLVRHGPALDAAEIEVGLVIDAPHLFGNERAVHIGEERCVRVHVDDGRHATIVGLVHVGVDAERAFLEAPIGPHGDVVVHFAVAALDADGIWQIEHVPYGFDPGANAHDDEIGLDSAPVGLDRAHRAGTTGEAEPRHLDPCQDAHALGFRLAGEAVDARRVVGVAALLLMQDGGDSPRLPVAEESLHVGVAVLGAFDEGGVVADRGLLRRDGGDVFVHGLGADLHVAHGMVAVSFGILLPDRDTIGHQLAHGGLEVIVADHTAGDARGAGGDRGLVDDQDVGAAAPAAFAQGPGQVIGRAQAMDTGADDDVLRVGGKCHGAPLLGLRHVLSQHPSR
uniref:Uncharacterized protein n=1 Tax=uncultured marine microorganism HF4000_APKG8L7 TaxID=455556 RepID=B3TB83_9ZZZZ|nr:hypothetical protein ALOHA_HF4000APKG8L7ctg1g17 [uncultured marine microorganism HF4000_APKG8L7]